MLSLRREGATRAQKTPHPNPPEVPLKKRKILVIGAGSAGRYAARQAASLGAEVVLASPPPFGGLCILKGCMPSKALLRPAHVLHLLRTGLSDLGISLDAGSLRIDIPTIVAMKNSMIREMAESAHQSVTGNPGIRFIPAPATFLSHSSARVGDEVLHFDRAIVATGSTPRIPEIPGINREWLWTSDDLLECLTLPRSVVVMGAGPVGLELGQYLSMLGVRVEVVEISHRWNPNVDPRIGEGYIAALEKSGLRVHLGMTAHRFETSGGRPILHATRKDGDALRLEADRILFATGRQAAVTGIGCEHAGIVLSHAGAIAVDPCLRTSNPHIFAAGDVTGHLPVLNLATYHGEMAGTNAVLDPPRIVEERPVPLSIFTEPEFARVGISESEARERAIPVLTGYLPFSELGRAIVNRQTEGALKITASAKTREILGAEMFGPGAADLIHLIGVAISLRATVDTYQRILHIHPTMAEIVRYVIDEMTDAL